MPTVRHLIVAAFTGLVAVFTGLKLVENAPPPIYNNTSNNAIALATNTFAPPLSSNKTYPEQPILPEQAHGWNVSNDGNVTLPFLPVVSFAASSNHAHPQIYTTIYPHRALCYHDS